jgi:hypothetical protein
MFFTFTLLSGLLASQAAAQLTKPVISPPFPGLDSGLMANLPSTSSTTSYWGWGCEKITPIGPLFRGI